MVEGHYRFRSRVVGTVERSPCYLISDFIRQFLLMLLPFQGPGKTGKATRITRRNSHIWTLWVL